MAMFRGRRRLIWKLRFIYQRILIIQQYILQVIRAGTQGFLDVNTNSILEILDRSLNVFLNESTNTSHLTFFLLMPHTLLVWKKYSSLAESQGRYRKNLSSVFQNACLTHPGRRYSKLFVRIPK